MPGEAGMEQPRSGAEPNKLGVRSCTLGIAGVLVLINLSAFVPDVVPLLQTSRVLDPRGIDRAPGLAFRADLQRYESEGVLFESRLTSWRPMVESKLVLFEGGKALGPSHSFLERVRGGGRGAYSHRGTALHFSTSDNTDPRTNGREYRVSYPLFVHKEAKGAIAALSLLFLGGWIVWIGAEGRRRLLDDVERARTWAKGRRDLRRLGYAASLMLVTSGIVFLNYVMLETTRSLPCLNPDSAGYFTFSVNRTVGYPLFVHAVLTLFGDIRWLVPVQLNLLLGAFVLLGLAVAYAFRSVLAGMVVVLSLFVSIPLLVLSCHLLSEALYIPVLCLHVVAVLMLLHRKRKRWALLAGMTMGLAIGVRPAGYALLAGLPVLLLCIRDRRLLMAGLLVGGAALVILGAGLVQYERSGILGTQSLGGLSLVGHVAPILMEDVENDYPQLTRRIAQRIRPLAADLEGLSFPREHWQKTSRTYNTLLWENVFPEILEHLRRHKPGLGSVERDVRANDIAMALATSAILERPWWYVRHASAHFLGLWQGFGQDHGPVTHQILRCQGRTVDVLQRNLRVYTPAFDVGWYARPSTGGVHRQGADQWLDAVSGGVPFFRQPVVLGVFVITAMVLVSGVWVRSPSILVQAIAYLAVLLHGSLAFVAAVQAGLERYSLPLKPVLVVIVVGVVLLAVRWLGKEGWPRLAPRTVRTA